MSAPAPAIRCPSCSTPLPDWLMNRNETGLCPGCTKPTLLEVYPALLRPRHVGKTGETIIVPGEASCFYHAEKRAAVPCGICGRFLCALCDLEIDGQHLCPGCLESGQKTGKLQKLENRRVLYDSAAAGLAILPLFIWPLTALTAPAALVMAIYAWNKPRSIVSGSRSRIYVALFFALTEIAVWVIVLVSIFTR